MPICNVLSVLGSASDCFETGTPGRFSTLLLQSKPSSRETKQNSTFGEISSYSEILFKKMEIIIFSVYSIEHI
jgi:hypothetical protein